MHAVDPGMAARGAASAMAKVISGHWLGSSLKAHLSKYRRQPALSLSVTILPGAHLLSHKHTSPTARQRLTSTERQAGSCDPHLLQTKHPVEGGLFCLLRSIVLQHLVLKYRCTWRHGRLVGRRLGGGSRPDDRRR